MIDLLASHKVTAATVLPGSGRWLTQGAAEATLATGVLEGGEPSKLTFGGKRAVEYGVIALHGIDASTLAMSDGAWVTRLELSEKALKPVKRWRLPGELGWRAQLASSEDGSVIAVASDGRLAVYGAHEQVLQAGSGFAENFMCVALLPGGRRLVTGRGDGRVELRDAHTLELVKALTVLEAAAMHLCVMDERTVAVADDDANTGLLDLETGVFSELSLGRMKTSGLHRLADGRLVVVGLSRRVTVFSGTTRLAEADFSEALGDRYVAGSAVEGDTLVLACEQRGLHKVRLSQLPAGPAPLDLPRPAQAIRADATFLVAFTRLTEAIAAKQDVSSLVGPLLETTDENQLRAVFSMLQREGVVLPDAAKYLRSPIERVRYYTADQYGALRQQYAGRALELEPLMTDESPQVVAAALWAMEQLGDSRSVPSLCRALTHADPRVRNTAALGLLTLRAGKDELVAAIRAGAGELTLATAGKLWPRLSPALLELVDPTLLRRLAAGLPLGALLTEIGVDASPAFLEPLAAKTFAITTPLTRIYEVVWKLVEAHRWAVRFADDRLGLLTTAEAADWWDAELTRRFRS